MKKGLPLGVCILIALVLVVFGIAFGTLNGFRDERGRVTALLTEENGVQDALWYYGADGCNLSVVASRHLPEDAYAALRENAAVLQSDTAGIPQKKAALSALNACADSVSQSLRQVFESRQDSRDASYLSMILSDMKNLSPDTSLDAYNASAAAFNQKLASSPIFGRLATLLGLESCPLYE